jgi:hypothetical protein
MVLRGGLFLKSFLFFFILTIISIPSISYAHSGRTDSYGGHNKTSNGTYHCHSGQCLDDAWDEANDSCYPKGKEDALQGQDRSNEIQEKLTGKMDIDVAEYMIPYCIDAYEKGFVDNYIPTFTEKYGLYIGGGSTWLMIVFYIKYIKQHKKNPLS